MGHVVPTTTKGVRTSHAISIYPGTGGPAIGQIQTWAPSQTRTITPVWELKSETSGDVIDNIPGNVSGLTIQVSRYDLFTEKMEEVWGSASALWMLGRQLNPLNITEKWRSPGSGGLTESYLYTGCWFSQIGRNMQAQGDRIIMVNATLNYVNVSRQS